MGCAASRPDENDEQLAAAARDTELARRGKEGGKNEKTAAAFVPDVGWVEQAQLAEVAKLREENEALRMHQAQQAAQLQVQQQVIMVQAQQQQQQQQLQQQLQQQQQQVAMVTTTTMVQQSEEPARLARLAPLAPPSESLEQLTEAGLQQIFSLFAHIDVNNSGIIDANELAAAIDKSAVLRGRLCAATGLPSTHVGSTSDVVAAVLAKADLNKDGGINPAELERLIRGWAGSDFEKVGAAAAAAGDERRRLAGAKARADAAREEGGGFAGLTDASEALRIGAAAQQYTAAEKNLFSESEPTVFSMGAHYVGDAAAKAERDEVDRAIRQQEHDEYLYKEQFAGLSAEEALKAGESVQLGGVVVEDAAEAPKKKLPKGLAKKMREKGKSKK